jgi:hypothetical protein
VKRANEREEASPFGIMCDLVASGVIMGSPKSQHAESLCEFAWFGFVVCIHDWILKKGLSILPTHPSMRRSA